MSLHRAGFNYASAATIHLALQAEQEIASAD